jgi:hypothetical protein
MAEHVNLLTGQYGTNSALPRAARTAPDFSETQESPLRRTTPDVFAPIAAAAQAAMSTNKNA